MYSFSVFTYKSPAENIHLLLLPKNQTTISFSAVMILSIDSSLIVAESNADARLTHDLQMTTYHIHLR